MGILQKGFGPKQRKLVPWFMAIMCCLTVASFAYNNFYPYMMTHFDMTARAPFAFGSTILGFTGMLLLPPLLGPVVDKFGPKPVLALGCIMDLLAIPCMNAMWGTNDWSQAEIWWWAGSACYGFVGGCGSTCHASLSTKWNPDNASKANGIALIGPTLGTFWMAPLIAAIVPSMGVGGCCTVISLIGACGFLFFGVLPMRLPDPGWKPEGWNPPAQADPEDMPGMTLSEALHSVKYWMLIACIFFVTFGCFLFAMNLSLLVQEGISTFGGVDKKVVLATMLPTISMVTAVINSFARPVWGIIMSKLGCWKTLIFVYIGFAVSLVLFTFIYGSFIGCMVGACLVYAFFGGTAALHFAAGSVLFGPKAIGRILGTTQIAVGIGWLGGPYLGAFLADMTGTYRAPLLVAAAMTCVGIILAIYMSIKNPVAEYANN